MSGFYEEKKSLLTMSDEQKNGAMVMDNPVLLVAGAGSGKTRTLIGRGTKLLLPKEHEGMGADPSSLMMVTFTNKAGREMRERFTGVLDALRDNGIHGEPWIGTFHSISMRILRIEARHAGYKENFTIMDDSDAREVAKEAAQEVAEDAARARGEDISKVEVTFDIDEFFSNLEYAKARLISPELIIRKKAEIDKLIEENKTLSPLQNRWNEVLHANLSPGFPPLYQKYQDILAKNNAVDFSDLINQVTTLFQNRHDIRDSWRSTFRHFMIDETQDMNPAQGAWLSQITGNGAETIISEDAEIGLAFDDATAGNHSINNHRLRAFPKPTIAFVGDDDQSIYAFRGSDTGIMLGLNRSYEGLETRYLTESYRCQPNILSAANRLIGNNENRFDKEVVAADKGRTGSSVIIKEYKTYGEEYERLAQEISEHIEAGGKPSDFGVLLRTRNAVKDVAKFLREKGLPVTEGKASDIRKSAEVKDVMSYAGFIINPEAEMYLRRIINKPARGMGLSSIGNLATNAKKKNISFTDELRSVMNKRIEVPDGGKPYKKAFVSASQSFGYMMVNIRKKIASMDAKESLVTIMKDSGYMDMLYDDVMSATGLSKHEKSSELRKMEPRDFMRAVLMMKGDKEEANAENMEDLADAAGQLSDGMRRVANIALLLEQAEAAKSLTDFVQESTLEMSETKDAPGVNVMTMHASKGLEFDHVRLPLWYTGMMPMSEDKQEMEEERRLAYVSLTRGRHSAIITYPTDTTGARFAMGKGGKVKASPFLREMIGKSPDVVRFSMWGKREGTNAGMPPRPGTDIDFAKKKPAYQQPWQKKSNKEVKVPDFKWKSQDTADETRKEDLFNELQNDLFNKVDSDHIPESLFDDEHTPF